MPRYRALQKTYVDHVLRVEGEIFDYYGETNDAVIQLVPEVTPTGMPPPDSSQPLLPHERVPRHRNENLLGGNPHDPGPAVAPPPRPENVEGAFATPAPAPITPTKDGTQLAPEPVPQTADEASAKTAAQATAPAKAK